MQVKKKAYLSLGSNLGDRAANLHAAIARLGKDRPLNRTSSFYETQPVGVPNQPWFLNCVLAIETEETPRELLKALLALEKEMGRTRTREKGPRNIDIDLLLFSDNIVDEPGLKVPHPAMHLRRFVLEPLAEIAPEARHPILRKTAHELLSSLPPGQAVRRLDT